MKRSPKKGSKSASTSAVEAEYSTESQRIAEHIQHFDKTLAPIFREAQDKCKKAKAQLRGHTVLVRYWPPFFLSREMLVPVVVLSNRFSDFKSRFKEALLHEVLIRHGRVLRALHKKMWAEK